LRRTRASTAFSRTKKRPQRTLGMILRDLDARVRAAVRQYGS
jgi:hypothetical protein